VISTELQQALVHAQQLAKRENRMDIFGVLNSLYASIITGNASELDRVVKSWLRTALDF
jgi:hypothetical protein